MDENLFSEKRMQDLSNQSDRKGIVIFSDFLNLNELNIFHQNEKKYVTKYDLSGGYELAERQIAAFIPDALYYTWHYPIDCIEIIPSYPKFADVFTHRDILGAVMNLGIERSKIGDIILQEKKSYLFCKNEISKYILNELSQIKHTIVTSKIIEDYQISMHPNFEEKEIIIASNRIDNIISGFCNISRSEAVLLLQSGKVYINGRQCLHNTYICKPSDVVSVRSYGKYIFTSEIGETKKGRLKIHYQHYI